MVNKEFKKKLTKSLTMSEVFAVKLPKNLKEAMRRVSGEVNWPEEIRGFIQRRVSEAEAEENMRKVLVMLQGTGSVEKGFAAGVVREDRESR